MAGRRATSIGIDCDEAPGASGCVDRSDSEGRCEGDGGGDGGGGGNGGGGPGRGRGGEGGGGGESVITREGVRLKLPKSSGRGVVVATAAATVVVIVAVSVGGGGELPPCGARSRLGTGDGAEEIQHVEVARVPKRQKVASHVECSSWDMPVNQLPAKQERKVVFVRRAIETGWKPQKTDVDGVARVDCLEGGHITACQPAI